MDFTTAWKLARKKAVRALIAKEGMEWPFHK